MRALCRASIARNAVRYTSRAAALGRQHWRGQRCAGQDGSAGSAGGLSGVERANRRDAGISTSSGARPVDVAVEFISFPT